jgi:hypothetical protein
VNRPLKRLRRKGWLEARILVMIFHVTPLKFGILNIFKILFVGLNLIINWIPLSLKSQTLMFLVFHFSYMLVDNLLHVFGNQNLPRYLSIQKKVISF